MQITRFTIDIKGSYNTADTGVCQLKVFAGLSNVFLHSADGPSLLARAFVLALFPYHLALPQNKIGVIPRLDGIALLPVPRRRPLYLVNDLFCFDLTFLFTPVIHESTSFAGSPSPSFLTCLYHASIFSCVGCTKVILLTRAQWMKSATQSTAYSMLRGILPNIWWGPMICGSVRWLFLLLGMCGWGCGDFSGEVVAP
jgi:hypothetical protein